MDDEDENEYGDERKQPAVRVSDRLQRAQAALQRPSNAAVRNGYLMQCAFCGATDGISLPSRDGSAALQHCRACARTYRATPAPLDAQG